jgi:hypothetical protein
MNFTKLEGTSYSLKYILATLLLSLAAVYIYNANTAIGFGDALGFVWALEKDGFDWSTNATSHFGYINAVKLFTYILPFVSAFSIATAFSIAFAIATVCVLYKIILLLTQNHLTSILATLTFAFSFTFWRQTEIVEVYTFNLFVYAIMLFLAIKIYLKQSKKTLWLACILAIGIYV